MKFLIYQLEKGESGTPHLQGYLQLLQPGNLDQMRLLIPGAHWEACKGSPKQNIAYCSKPEGRVDGPWRFGLEPAQGKRSDWSGLRQYVENAIVAGQTDDEISDYLLLAFTNLWATQGTAVQRLIAAQRRICQTFVTRSPPTIKVYWGPTGTGKTRRCWEEAGTAAFAKMQGKWFDGYEGQENVILDEFPDESIPLTLLLQMLDRYPLRVEVKGGSVGWSPRRIWISSNLHPGSWYPDAQPAHRAALMRRLTEFGAISLIGEEDAGGEFARPSE